MALLGMLLLRHGISIGGMLLEAMVIQHECRASKFLLAIMGICKQIPFCHHGDLLIHDPWPHNCHGALQRVIWPFSLKTSWLPMMAEKSLCEDAENLSCVDNEIIIFVAQVL